MLDHTELLTGVSLYYLTKSFVPSAFIYAQNPNGFRAEYTKAATDAPLLFSAFKYNLGFWPPAKVAQVGNLVRYQSRLELDSGIARPGVRGCLPCELNADFLGRSRFRRPLPRAG